MKRVVGLGVAAVVILGVLVMAWPIDDTHAVEPAEPALGTAALPSAPTPAARPVAPARTPPPAAARVPAPEAAPAPASPTALEQAEAELTAFRAVHYAAVPPEADRSMEDGHLARMLTQKAEMMRILEEALAPLAVSDEPRTAAVALLMLGDTHSEMGDWLYEMPHPSYLTAEQADMYQMALTDKADAQWLRAEAAYVQAGERAEALGDASLRAKVETQLAGLPEEL